MWADTFGVKIDRYHEDNISFSEQHFRSAIEYYNHTITFCGVGSHNQNSIVESKIQTLTLGYRTLLINAKKLDRFNN